MCRYLVACDLPGPALNPFRELVPLALAREEHAFLLHILIATSALHLSNICGLRPATPLVSMREYATPFGSEGGLHDYSRRAFMDALVAKQKAIRHLRWALGTMQPTLVVAGELLLAAVLFFVNFELIDYGSSGWRAHLVGATRIMTSLLSTGSVVATSSAVSSLLRDCILSECFM